MSVDYYVITCRKPERSDIDSFLSNRTHITSLGSLNWGERNMLICHCTGTKNVPCLTLDGPFRVEPTDFADEISSIRPTPTWLLEICLPHRATKRDFSFAKALARHVAQSCEGVVCHPDRHTLLWPKPGKKSYGRAGQEQRIRLIELKWFIPHTMSSARSAELLLAILGERCAEALPTRYGPFEPFQKKFDPLNNSHFLEAWQASSEGGSVQHLFWDAKDPCFGGSVSFPPILEKNKLTDASSPVQLAMSFDSGALELDERWCETIVDLFLNVARSLRAFYATGYVRRNVIVKRSITFDGKTEEAPLPRSRRWLGIPDKPTWLSWFGASYKPLVAKAIPASLAQSSPEGIFVRLGSRPMDKDQLRDFAPHLPPHLLIRYDTVAKSSRFSGCVSSLRSITPEQVLRWQSAAKPKPAKYIPNL